MKYIWVLLVLSLVLVSCQSVQELPVQEAQEEESMDDMNHIGCQEDEIGIDGECVPAQENNAQLFGQDFSESVMSQDIVEDGFQGYLARPTQEGSYPAVLMIHEWWGLNDNIKEMANILADQGYVVLAIDLYDGSVATTSDEARVLATSVRSNPDDAVEKMNAAVAYLREDGASKVGSLGWCFGGQQSLAVSLNGTVDATVIYYGSLTDDTEQLQNINGPVLGIFGEEDSSISVESVESFKSSLVELDIPSNVYIYKGVGHAFANPSGSNYAPKETLDAWDKTVTFFEENLKE